MVLHKRTLLGAALYRTVEEDEIGEMEFLASMQAVRLLFDLCSTVLLLYLWGTSKPSRERS